MRKVLHVILWVSVAASTCVVDHTGRSMTCQSPGGLAAVSAELAADMQSLKIVCPNEKPGNWTLEAFESVTELTIRNCGIQVVDIILKSTPTLGSKLSVLRLPSNNISTAPWLDYRSTASLKLDLRENNLSCGDCANFWIWEMRKDLGRSSRDITRLPREVDVDASFDAVCNFTFCPRETVHRLPTALDSDLHLGGAVNLSCQVDHLDPSRAGEKTDALPPSSFFWPYAKEIDPEDDSFNWTLATRIESWDSATSIMSLALTDLTSHELGYVYCICYRCIRPAFAPFDLNYSVPLSASLREPLGHDPYVVVHGNPLTELTMTITRLADNASESAVLKDTKTSFFNDSLTAKYNLAISHYFAHYYTLKVRECPTCAPHVTPHIDGDYVITVCRRNNESCAAAVGRIVNTIDTGDKEPEHPFPKSGSSESKFAVLAVVLLLVVLFVLVFVTLPNYIKHKLLKKGWELKRRRTSRNTDRTEETSIRLEDYSTSPSLNYIVQHVPLIDKTSLEVKGKLGKGAFGEVYRAVWKDGSQEKPVAMKMLYNVQLDTELDKEAALLAKLDHPNVVKLFGLSRWDTQVALVMEMMSLGDLKTYVRDRAPRCDNYSQFPPAVISSELVNIAGQVAAGLCYLTSQQIVHRDLAARNCLVDGESDIKICNAAFRKPVTVKISDFGMSRRLYSESEYYKMQNGKTVLPVRWLPPECLASGRFTPYSDMWSFGMTLFEIFSYGAIPYGDLSNNEVLTAVVSGMRPELPSSFPEPIRNLIAQCWRTVPEERITAAEMLQRLQIIQ